MKPARFTSRLTCLTAEIRCTSRGDDVVGAVALQLRSASSFTAAGVVIGRILNRRGAAVVEDDDGRSMMAAVFWKRHLLLGSFLGTTFRAAQHMRKRHRKCSEAILPCDDGRNGMNGWKICVSL